DSARPATLLYAHRPVDLTADPRLRHVRAALWAPRGPPWCAAHGRRGACLARGGRTAAGGLAGCAANLSLYLRAQCWHRPRTNLYSSAGASMVPCACRLGGGPL